MMVTRDEPIWVPIFPFSMESFCNIRSASDAWPRASCINTPVSSGSMTTGNLPEGGSSALRSRIAFSAVTLPNFSRSSFCMTSKPAAPPVLLCPNCMIPSEAATAFINRATLLSSIWSSVPSLLTKMVVPSPST
ncbi:MAG: hypothetical protein A4E26_01491 [Methanobacterium sp. PtaU1.Bin097]|nr:MAG: hypothetical protein A4E26_01491 [Methanobacterium sp. PtaU1.Bin097]